MSQSTTSTTTLPQGFSVFQPSLGAQLQFFPAMGSQELDDLVNAYVPGTASVQEKRASIALDFFEHTQLTGQSFKFYPVFAAPSATPSPSTSAASSFNVSPMNQTWDWSQTSRAGSVSSHTSTNRVSKASASRQRATDFNALPGMKIMTKDGRDVTNSASRGSKTKEQRDHAHLMRIIKACDSCRKKKIRCDPSHKKRGAAQVSAPAKVAKAISSPPQPQPSPPQSISPPVTLEDFAMDATTFGLDTNFDFDLSALETSADLWDDFVQFPAADDYGDFNLFTDLDGSVSSQSSIPSSSSSSGGSGPVSPTRTDAPHGPMNGRALASEIAASTVLAQLDTDVYNDYTDFNLYSPGSTFSEDDRMLDIASSSSGQSSVSQSPRDEVNYGAEIIGNADVLRASLETVADGVGLGQNHDRPAAFNVATESNAASVASTNYTSSAVYDGVSFTTNASGQLVICCPPGMVAVANGIPANNNVRIHRYRLSPFQKLTVIQVASTAVASSPVHTADIIPVRIAMLCCCEHFRLTMIQDLNDSLAAPSAISVGAHGDYLAGILSDGASVNPSHLVSRRVEQRSSMAAAAPSPWDVGAVYHDVASRTTTASQLSQPVDQRIITTVQPLVESGTIAALRDQTASHATAVGYTDQVVTAQNGTQQISTVGDVDLADERGGVGRIDRVDRHRGVVAAADAVNAPVDTASNTSYATNPTQLTRAQQDIASAMSLIATQAILAAMLCNTVASLQAGASPSVRPVLPTAGHGHTRQQQRMYSDDLVLTRPPMVAVV